MTEAHSEALDFSYRATDRMFVAQGVGEPGAAEVAWQEGRLEPTGPLDLSPAAAVLSYGLGIFEGLKIHRTADGRLLSFRVSAHAERFRRSARILGMAPFPVADFRAAVADLVRANAAFVPPCGEGSLYVRALQFADETMLGLAPCRSYRVAMYGSPVGPYFAARGDGIRLRLLRQSRVAGGGTGGAKAIGNYAGSLAVRSRWQAQGFDDVLYSDAGADARVTETTGSNLFVRLADGSVATPALNDQILPGITRDAVIHLLRRAGETVVERDLPAQEIYAGGREAFCTGTAWTVQPVGELCDETHRHRFARLDTSERLRRDLEGIKTGARPDPQDWTEEIPR